MAVQPGRDAPLRHPGEGLDDDGVGHLRGAELEIVVMQWLSDMSRGRGLVPPGSDAMNEFAKRLRGGTVHGGSGL